MIIIINTITLIIRKKQKEENMKCVGQGWMAQQPSRGAIHCNLYGAELSSLSSSSYSVIIIADWRQNSSSLYEPFSVTDWGRNDHCQHQRQHQFDQIICCVSHCLTFPHCVFSNISSNQLVEQLVWSDNMSGTLHVTLLWWPFSANGKERYNLRI